jgi:phenylpyruvate tautomerase PptA (4-oxalocrotonate tautomerase family)
MPVVLIEVPPGIDPEAKRRMMEKITSVLEEVYPLGETLIFLREYALEDVAENGRFQSKNSQVLEAARERMSAPDASEGGASQPEQQPGRDVLIYGIASLVHKLV